MTTFDFPAVLTAPGRSSEIPESADAYGWLIGSWELDVHRYVVDVRERHIKGEAHFAWVLEGRAVQDVWIMHGFSEYGAMHGTTLRLWDPTIQAWRITWINPPTGRRDELIGRWSGNDVVQIGTHGNGVPVRWMFTEITRDSFHWLGEALEPDGNTWKPEGEFRARRMH